jgi:hypothetical protein
MPITSEYIYVRFGGSGTQLAHVLSAGPLLIHVRKWSMRSKKWTQPITVDSRDYRGPAIKKDRIPTPREYDWKERHR